jgi:hypothetical protein
MASAILYLICIRHILLYSNLGMHEVDRVRERKDIVLMYEALWLSISHSKIPALDEVFRHKSKSQKYRKIGLADNDSNVVVHILADVA